MEEIAGDDRPLAPRLDRDADVPGRVARSRNQAHLFGHLVAGLDQVDEAGLEDRKHRVGLGFGRVGIVLVLPEPPLGLAHQVARVRKGRHPAAVLEDGVPPDVIEVQMGAQDPVHRRGREPDAREIFEKGGMQFGHPERARLVADTGIDDDSRVSRAHRKGVDAELEIALGVCEMGAQPALEIPERLGGRLGNQPGCGEGLHDVDYPGDLDISDLPTLHLYSFAPAGSCFCSSSFFSFKRASSSGAPPWATMGLNCARKFDTRLTPSMITSITSQRPSRARER